MAISLLYQKIIQGGFYYFGNALGLTKGAGAIVPGSLPTQGAFITTNTLAQAAGGWPLGTTLNWEEGSSYVYVDIPAGDVIDKAFLIWGGSTGTDVTSAARLFNVYMITPDNIKHIITPVTTLNGSGFYSSSADVTNIVSGFSAGNFIVGSIPANITPTATAGEGGGWVLALATKSNVGAYNYMTLCISNDNYIQVGTSIPIVTPSSGVVTGKLMNAIIDAACSAGDALILGNKAPFSAPYREAPNFYNSIISNNSGDGLPYTNASFGNSNNSPLTRSNNLNARQGLDLAIYYTSGDIPPGSNTYYLDGYNGGIAFSPTDGNTNYIAYGTSLNPSNATSELEKTVDKDMANYGDTLIYTLKIKLSGVGNVNVLKVFDTLPDNVTLVPGSIRVNGVTTPLANLITGISLGNTIVLPYTGTITYSATIAPSGGFSTVNNDFYVTFTNPVSNGTVFTNTVVSSMAVTTIINAANINLNKLVDIKYGTINEILTYTIIVNNSGNLDAEGTMLIDTLPNDVTLEPNSLFINGILNPSTSNPIIVDMGTIASSQMQTITFKVKVVNTIPTPNPILNSSFVSYSYTGNTGVVNVDTISNITTTTINYGSMNTEKFVDKTIAILGDTITYTIPITYGFGNVNLTDVIFVDTIPTSNSLIPGSLMVNNSIVGGSIYSPGINVGLLSVGEVKTISFKVLVNSVPTINPIPNSSFLSYGYIINPSLPKNTVQLSTNIVDTFINNSSVLINKKVDKTVATPGDSVTYTIVVTNSGNVTISNTTLYDTVPNGTVYVNNSLSVDGVLTGGTPENIPLNNIAPNQVVTVVFTVIIN